MPQFDFYSFFSQIFWFSILSCLFYLMYLKLPLYNSAEVLKFRFKIMEDYSSFGKKKVTSVNLYDNIFVTIFGSK